MARPLGCGWGSRPPDMEVSLEDIGQPTRSGPPAWGFGVRLATSHCKNEGVQKRHTGPRNWTDNLERPIKRESLYIILIKFGIPKKLD